MRRLSSYQELDQSAPTHRLDRRVCQPGSLGARRGNEIARAAGIPDTVWNMDARAGGATEADEAGAALEAIQSALTHTKESTTLRYLRRGRSNKIGLVAEARRTKRATENDGGTA
jgi:hypothetical protein